MSKNPSSVHSSESICQLKTLLVSCYLIYSSENLKIQVRIDNKDNFDAINDSITS